MNIKSEDVVERLTALGYNLEEGDTLIMPKDIPHAVYGEEQFKMQLVVSY